MSFAVAANILAARARIDTPEWCAKRLSRPSIETEPGIRTEPGERKCPGLSEVEGPGLSGVEGYN
jgi:hypothetical protein